ncbi:SET domain-containing protein [Cubamyces lactineus]|nr:SET domain-containing protein [Cubamyces lactineus]
MDDLDTQRWERLLVWLRDKHGMDTAALRIEPRTVPGAGRGLFATKDIPPSSILFEIPSGALLNAATVLPLYPQIKEGQLSGTQLVSLHLLLHKPSGDADSSDPIFGPYITTLPRDFSSHPLTWLVNRQRKKEDAWSRYLLDHVPPSAWQAISKLEKRFWKDWDAVAGMMGANLAILTQSTRPELRNARTVEREALLSDYLWAWLNVNTRCIFYRIRQNRSDPDNFTLCPILDFANHGTERTHIFPVVESEIWGTAGQRTPAGRKKAKADTFAFYGPSDITVSQGRELLLKYGAHSNRFLFSEYGFVTRFRPSDMSSGSFEGEVDVQEFVEEMIEKAGPIKTVIKFTLEDSGYWGDWTLHSAPRPAHPSWRLITVLRLLCALERYSTPTFETRTAINAWMDVTNGVGHTISSVNERRWRQRLLEICEAIRVRAQSSNINKSQGGPSWVAWMAENVRILWREELEVAEAVIASIHAGEEF